MLLIPVACSRKEPSSETTPLGAADGKANSAIQKIYLVDGDTSEQKVQANAPDRLPLERATLTKSFVVVIRLYQIVPQQPYKIGFSLEDSKGKVLEAVSNEITINSSDSEGWAYFPVSLNPAQHAGGKWKAKFAVSGLGSFDHEFEVQPLTGEEKLELADHEEAKKQAIKAFSHFWVAVPQGKQITYVTATGELGTDDGLKRYRLYQVSGLTLATNQAPLSDADKLNGISYRGSVGFGFTIYRSYSPKEGWNEWKDLVPPQNLLAAGWKRLAGNAPANPDVGQQAPGMRFRIQCRDGNWVVVTDEQARFINGTRKDDQAAVAARKAEIAAEEEEKEEERLAKQRNSNPALPTPVEPSDYKNYLKEAYGDAIARRPNPYGNEVFTGHIFQPRVDFIASIVQQEASGRENLKQIAAEVQASPETLKEQQAMTIKSLQDRE